MNKTISILGSTGSIGRQALEVIESLGMRAAALTGNRNTDLLEEQARRFQPRLVAVADQKSADDLRLRLRDTDIKVCAGQEGLMEAATVPGADTVLTAVVGMVGLKPTLAAIDAGRQIALANKETLVCAGELVMARANASGAQILPVDSEHSAIFQCLEGNRDKKAVKRLLLTASGGPFFRMTRTQLEKVTKQQALCHPNWSMGAKITVDSATLMNKGLEFIEAMHLFGVTPQQISILIHRESVIHSMVEYRDGSVIAQMAKPDMRLPIQYALTYPDRLSSLTEGPDFTALKPLSFAKPDLETFGCLKLALRAAEAGGTACAVLNAANEVAVSLFLEGKCRFLEIEHIVEETVSAIAPVEISGLSSVLEADRAAREVAASCALERD